LKKAVAVTGNGLFVGTEDLELRTENIGQVLGICCYDY
jgi:hypothetical protein